MSSPVAVRQRGAATLGLLLGLQSGELSLRVAERRERCGDEYKFNGEAVFHGSPESRAKTADTGQETGVFI